jgi:hypothetical protein
VASGVLAPFVGRIVDSTHPRPIVGFGFSVLAVALTWLSIEMTPTTAIWRLVLPLTAMGVGMAFIWAPLATTATRNLPPRLAGAGSGVYNATRQVGSVLGSAGMAAFMAARISDELSAAPANAAPSDLAVLKLPEFLHEPFATALSQSMLLPAFVALFGIIGALFLVGGLPRRIPGPRLSDDDEVTDWIPVYDEGYDDDDYIEYVVSRETDYYRPSYPPVPVEVDDETEQIVWRRPEPEPEPIGFAHNGFHVDDGRSRFADLFADFHTGEAEPRSRHRLSDGSEPHRPRHYRDDPDGAETYGRHSMPRPD